MHPHWRRGRLRGILRGILLGRVGDIETARLSATRRLAYARKHRRVKDCRVTSQLRRPRGGHDAVCEAR